MEKERIAKIKEILLLGFVSISVVLIVIVWFNAFQHKNVENPYFYRELPQQSEVTESAATEQVLQTTATTTPGSKHETTPTQTPGPVPLFTPESDN